MGVGWSRAEEAGRGVAGGGGEGGSSRRSKTSKSSLSPLSTSRKRSAVVFEPGSVPNPDGSTPLEDWRIEEGEGGEGRRRGVVLLL